MTATDDPIRPGYTTTEFWVTILSHVVAVIALVDPSVSVGTWTQPMAFIAAGLATAFYAVSRAHVKKAGLASTAVTLVQDAAGAVQATVKPPATVTTTVDSAAMSGTVTSTVADAATQAVATVGGDMAVSDTTPAG